MAESEACKSAVALFLGGTYVLLGVTAFCLFYRRKAGGRAVFMCAIAVMLCLAMQQASLEHQSNIVGFVEDLVLVTNNAIADGLFAYRCYLIWGPPFNKQVICLPILLLVITTVLGYVTVYRNDLSHPGTHIMDSRIGFIFANVTNLVLTGLTAGRIWRTRRQFRTLVGEKTAIRRYTNAISVLLESGAAYTLFLVLVILALTFGRTATSGPSAIFPSIAYGAAAG
ncbi:hypothetical protein R3P38DRAFT_2870122 [Favolaschia claudopus]|uniref:Uncharacterized protein n=1 Tax=Favolaschia claudopus TaxID=2862362 RepID=A0AAW0DAR5_9AGAR